MPISVITQGFDRIFFFFYFIIIILFKDVKKAMKIKIALML